jgi:predicted kinase
MEAIIFIGLQATGKSSFYREKFSDTHIRINLDMLKTRHREKILFYACLEAKQPLVIDNTNLTIEDRKRYLPIAKEKQFQIIGYYFKSSIEECQSRNSMRDRSIPIVALLATYKKLQIPTYQEGFDRLYYVSIDRNNSFVVEEWNAV